MARILISGGDVIDGTGGPPRRADVAIEDDRIVSVQPGLSRWPADEVVDATGRVVAPGFIDIHTHYDAQVFWDPALSSSCYHGVTTVVGGNCGFSLAPLAATERVRILQMLRDLEDMPYEDLDAVVPAEVPTFGAYFRQVAASRPLLNFASFVGHSTVRFAAMGAEAFEREATPAEVDVMRARVDEAMAAGAVGLATKPRPGARPSPSQYASTGETEALLRVLSERGGVAMFNPGGRFDLDHVYGFQAEVGRPFTWIALMVMPDGSHHDQMALHRGWYEKGVDVHPQVSCRPLVGACTMALPSVLRAASITELSGAATEERLRAYADSSWRTRFRSEVTSAAGPIRWHRVTVLDSPSAPDAIGRDLGSIAAGRGTDPADALLDLAMADRLDTRIELSYGNDDPDVVAQLLTLPGCVLGLSDAGAHPAQSCDGVLPTDLLGPWARDRGALPLETAVQKLTDEPAQLIGLTGRGRVEPGWCADLVVFDPATIAPGPIRLTRDMPAGGERLLADAPNGLDHMMVNGTWVRRDGAMLDLGSDARPGRVLASQGATIG
jgi:N-acyl-D-aspartate/D-glutamate deacylase